MIEDSLKYKISANDKKVKSLFRLKQKTNKKLSQRKNSKQKTSKINLNQKSKTKDLNISKENQNINSFIINKENHKNLINLELSPTLKAKPYIKNTKKTNLKMKYKELECFINKKITNNNISNNVSKTIPNNISIKTKHKKYISKSLQNKGDQRKRNISKSKRDLSYFDGPTPSSSCSLRKNISKSFDFNLTYERFIENETKKKERISKLKKRRERFEKKIYPHQPKINQKSKNLTKYITDDFLVRLEKYKKEQIEKAKNLKKIILKNEEDKINKNNYLIIQKKLNKKRMNNSFDKINNNKSITESVNKLFDWDKKRKEKLQKEIKKQALIEKNIHIPKINKSKNTIFKKDKIIQKIFDRLYNNNKYIFEFKKELLTEESTPKFNSLLNKTNSQPNISYNLKKIISSRSGFNKKYKEEVIINENICDTDNYNNTINDNNNDDEIKIINNTDRMVFNNIDNNINETSFSKEYKEDKEEKSKTKSLIVVIRKVKSQIDILNKKK